MLVGYTDISRVKIKSKYEKVGVLPIWILKSNISSVGVLFLSDEGPKLETLDFTIRIGSTPTVSYFNLYLYSAYAAVRVNIKVVG